MSRNKVVASPVNLNLMASALRNIFSDDIKQLQEEYNKNRDKGMSFSRAKKFIEKTFMNNLKLASQIYKDYLLVLHVYDNSDSRVIDKSMGGQGLDEGIRVNFFSGQGLSVTVFFLGNELRMTPLHNHAIRMSVIKSQDEYQLYEFKLNLDRDIATHSNLKAYCGMLEDQLRLSLWSKTKLTEKNISDITMRLTALNNQCLEIETCKVKFVNTDPG